MGQRTPTDIQIVNHRRIDSSGTDEQPGLIGTNHGAHVVLARKKLQ